MSTPPKGQPPTPEFPTPHALGYAHPTGDKRALDLGWCPTLIGCAVVSFAMLNFVLIAAGHGGGPARIILFEGTMDAWGSTIVLCWAGVAAQVVSQLLPRVRRAPRLFAYGTGVFASLTGWLTLVLASEATGLTLLTSIPFLCAVVAQAVCVALAMRRPTSRQP